MGREKLDHSTLGGLIAESYEPGSIFADMVRTAIFMHHGITDCVSLDEGISLAEKRKKKYSKEAVSRLRKVCEEEAAQSGRMSGRENDLPELCRKAKADIAELKERLNQLLNGPERKMQYGSIHFYLGMCERMLVSLLGDADVMDTVAFERNEGRDRGLSDEENGQIWKDALAH